MLFAAATEGGIGAASEPVWPAKFVGELDGSTPFRLIDVVPSVGSES